MKRPAIILGLLVLVAFAALLVQNVRRNAHAENCRNHLRLLALLVKQCAKEHGRLPPSTAYDGKGTPLQSWRLAAVQTREYFDFADHMDASQPWTTPQNRQFLEAFDDSIFACPSVHTQNGITQYVAVVGPGTVWDRNVNTDSIADETLLIIEWPRSDIYWAEPRDITLDELGELLTPDQFRTEHSSRLRYVDWSATVHEIPLNATTLRTIRRVAIVRATVNAGQTPTK